MTEILKCTKLSLLIYGLVISISGASIIILTAVPLLYLMNFFYFYIVVVVGGAMITIASLGLHLVTCKGQDWEQIQASYFLLYVIVIIMILFEAFALLAELRSVYVLHLALNSILLVTGIYSYTKQSGLALVGLLEEICF